MLKGRQFLCKYWEFLSVVVCGELRKFGGT